MGSPKKDARRLRDEIVASFAREITEAEAIALFEKFRRYLMLSGFVYRHDQTLFKTEFGDHGRVRAELVRLEVPDRRALMVKSNLRVEDHNVLTVMLERHSQDWLVLTRTEPPDAPMCLQSVCHLSSYVLLKGCAFLFDHNYRELLSAMFLGFHQELEQSCRRKMLQIESDLMEATEIKRWSKVLKP